MKNFNTEKGCVGEYFIFKMAIQNAGSVLKSRIGRVSGNTGIFFRPDRTAQMRNAQADLRFCCSHMASTRFLMT